MQNQFIDRVIKNRKLLGYTITIGIAIISGRFYKNVLITFDLFIFFAFLRVVILYYLIQNKDKEIFGYLLNDYEKPNNEWLVDIITYYGGITGAKEEIIAALPIRNICVKFDNSSSFVDSIYERAKMKAEIVYLFLALGFSIFTILIAVLPPVNALMEWYVLRGTA